MERQERRHGHLTSRSHAAHAPGPLRTGTGDCAGGRSRCGFSGHGAPIAARAGGEVAGETSVPAAGVVAPDGPDTTTSPLPTKKPPVGGLRVRAYFFLPWVWRACFLALVSRVRPLADLRSCRRCWSSLVVLGRPRRSHSGPGSESGDERVHPDGEREGPPSGRATFGRLGVSGVRVRRRLRRASEVPFTRGGTQGGAREAGSSPCVPPWLASPYLTCIDQRSGRQGGTQATPVKPPPVAFRQGVSLPP